MEQLLFLKHRLAGDVGPQSAEELVVGVGEDDRGMDFTAPQVVQLLHSHGGVLVGNGADGEGYEQFVGVHTGVFRAQVLYLEVLDGGYDLGGDELDLVGNVGKVLESPC